MTGNNKQPFYYSIIFHRSLSFCTSLTLASTFLSLCLLYLSPPFVFVPSSVIISSLFLSLTHFHCITFLLFTSFAPSSQFLSTNRHTSYVNNGETSTQSINLIKLSIKQHFLCFLLPVP